MPDLIPMNNAIVGVLSAELTKAIETTMLGLVDGLGIGVDYGMLMTDAGAWARQYAFDLVNKAAGGLDATQKARMQQIIGQLADGVLSKEDAVDLIRPMFGEVRAQMIATTEITRAQSEAAAMYKRELDKRGVETVERWVTAEDERVCEICGPLDNTTRDEWGQKFPDGPPAHPGCRCGRVVESAKKK
jgi:hypothetical protein